MDTSNEVNQYFRKNIMIEGMYLEIKRVFFMVSMFVLFQLVAVAKENVHPIALSETVQLAQYAAHYKILRKGTEYGKVVRSLIHNDGVYTLELTSKASAFFYSINTKQTSKFSLYGNDFHQISYKSIDDRSFKQAKRQTINFDHKNNIVLGNSKGKAWQKHLQTQIYDPLSVIEILKLNLSNKNVYRNYQVYDDAKIKDYLFVGYTEEVINTNVGELECVKVIRVRKNSTRKTSIWFSKKYNFVPVKVLQEKDGDEVATMILDSIELN